MTYKHRCLISVAALIALATIAAMQYGANAMAQPRGDGATNEAVSDDPFSPAEPPAASPNENPFSLTKQPVAQAYENPLGRLAPPRADADDTTPALTHKRPPQLPPNQQKRLLYAAQEAYEQSVADFRAGKVTDPEAVYRWSLRWMKAEEPLEDKSAPAAEQHLRRMMKLAELVKNASMAEDTSLHKLALNYYREEAESLLAKAMAKADKVAPAETRATISARGPDEYGVEAYQTAQAYLNAVLQGNFDAATALSRPGSAAGSRRLLVHVNELVDPEIVRIEGVHYPKSRKGRALVYIADVPLTKAQPDGHNKVPLAITLRLEKGRWLVTDLDLGGKELQQWMRTAAVEWFPLEPFAGEPFAPPSGDPRAAEPDEGPAELKQTKVFPLQHADAQQLRRTVTDLLSGTFNFRTDFDERTNSLLVHGTSEGVAAVEALIKQLDAPGDRPVSDEKRLVEPPGGAGYGGAR